MKRTIFATPCYLVIATMMLIASCKKGDTGPAGVPGPAGPAGTPGPAGPSGASKIIYSPWINVSFNSVVNSNGDTLRFVSNIPAPQLVDSILSKGEIKVYLNYGTPADPDVLPLPYFDPIFFNPPVVLNPDFLPLLITLTSNYNMGTFDENGAKRFEYRYIVIPGGTAGKAAPGEKTVDWNNYKEVQAYLGLKD